MYVIFIVSVLLFSQCKTPNSNTMTEEECRQMGFVLSEMWNNYFLNDEQSYARLDSALALIDTMLLCNCDVYKFNLIVCKISTLCEKKEFAEALTFANQTNDSLFLALYLKPLYLKRIKAMEAQEKGDISTRNALLQDIVIELKNYLHIPSAEIDSILKSKNVQDIYRYEKNLAISQYYFYRAQIEGTDKILNELDSLQQSIHGNQEFFDASLKSMVMIDFTPFIGL